MAIAFDAHTAAGISINANPVSSPQAFNHTVGSGSDRLLVVTVKMRGGGGAGGTVTGITFNGVALTAVDTEAINSTAHCVIFYLVNPDSGTHSVSVSHNMTGGTFLIVSATSLTGVHQTTPLNANNKAAAANSGPMTVSLTTTVADCWVIDCCAMRTSSNQAGTMTAVTNRVERTNASIASNGLRGLVSTIGPAAAAGSHTCEWTKSFSNDWAIMAAAFAPAGGGTTYNDTISESVTLSDSLAGTLTANGSLSESVIPSDSLSGTATFDGTLSESVTPSDSLAGDATFNDSLTESITTSDSLIGGLLLTGDVSESITLSDSLGGLVTCNGTIDESCTVTDSYGSVATFVDVLSESITLTDSLTGGLLLVESLSELITLTDSLTGDLTVNATLDEALTLSESYGAVATFAGLITESFTVTDSYTDTHIVPTPTTRGTALPPRGSSPGRPAHMTFRRPGSAINRRPR